MAPQRSPYIFNTQGKVDDEVDRALRFLSQAKDDHETAIGLLSDKVNATHTTSTTAMTVATAASAAVASTAAAAPYSPTAPINAQSGPYTLAQSDNAGLVVVNSTAAATITIGSELKAGFSCTIQNLGTTSVTVAPASGTINGIASLLLGSNIGLVVYWDGSNASAFTGYEALSNKAQANGYASLDGTGKVPAAQLPAGVSGTFALAALTATGTKGSITIANGVVTGLVASS